MEQLSGGEGDEVMTDRNVLGTDASYTRSAAEDSSHKRSVELRLEDIVAFLQREIGPNLTAYIAGKSPNTVARWSRSEQKAGDKEERRLRETYRIYQLITEADSNHVARAWLMGLNPQLDDQAPADVLREDRLRDALVAAKAFRVGG
jgi:thymidylate kinase